MAAGEEGVDSNLRRLFDDAFELLNALENKFESTSGEEYQKEVKKIIQMFEDATRMVSSLNVFSSNEDIEEVATNDIRFFLLPALLGSLTTKSNSENRLELLRTAEIYFKDFLQRCNDYGISKVDDKYFKNKSGDSETIPSTDLVALAKQRKTKMERFKAAKEMKSQIDEYRNLVENENVDEEVKRKYFLTLVTWWIMQSTDELDSIEKEKELLGRFSSMSTGTNIVPKIKPNTQPLKPIIITKTELQKKVYGLGYPSIPIMTVDEFYEQKVKDGTFTVPDTSLQTRGYDKLSIEEEDAIEKEKQLENDDEMALRKARDWDDWKDDNRRGWGNRKNKG